MNLRILKKLSKRAAPYLPLLGDDREQFSARRLDNYHGAVVLARKHFERMRSVHDEIRQEHEIKKPATNGKGWIRMAPPHHPRKGTIMVGSMTGYFEPEWDEECAWAALESLVFGHFTDYVQDADGDFTAVVLRPLRLPRDILRAASEMLAERAAA